MHKIKQYSTFFSFCFFVYFLYNVTMILQYFCFLFVLKRICKYIAVFWIYSLDNSLQIVINIVVVSWILVQLVQFFLLSWLKHQFYISCLRSGSKFLVSSFHSIFVSRSRMDSLVLILLLFLLFLIRIFVIILEYLSFRVVTLQFFGFILVQTLWLARTLSQIVGF